MRNVKNDSLAGTLLPPNPRRLYQMRKDGQFNIREFFTPFNKRTKRGPHVTLKCGDCNAKVVIDFGSDTVCINDVYGSINNWKEIMGKIFKKCDEQKDDADIRW